MAACGPSEATQGQETVSVRLLKKTDGLFYAAGADSPYTGQVVTFTKAGVRQSMENYLNGKAEGNWERYWPGGQLKREKRFQGGHQVLRQQWYENGALKEHVEMKDGIGYGKIRLWWPDGRLRRNVLVGDGLRPHGHVLEYAEDGSIIADAIFHHGKYVSGVIRKDKVANPIADLAD